jgi:uncharacterized Zn finger protein (UPF0148 family)
MESSNIDNDNNNNKNTNKNNDEEDPFKGIDKKLSDLMLRGWTMLAESCPIESCRCPLMRSPDGQKYCCNCEMWQFDNKKREKKKFTEIVPLKNQQNLAIKHMEVMKPIQNKITYLNDSIENVLSNKLKYLAERINNENDIRNLEELMKAFNNLIDTIKHYESLKKI